MESYSTMCRLCLANERNGVDLFRGGSSTEYTKLLEEMFRIELQDVPEWPSTACRACTKKLNDINDLKATITSSQEKLFQLLSTIRIKVEPVEVEENTYPRIVSVISLKEEMFGDGQELPPRDDLKTSSEDDVESSSEDDSTSGSDSESDDDVGPRRTKTQMAITSNRRTPDPKLEKMMRDLEVLQCQKCHRKFTSYTGLIKHCYSDHNTTHCSITCCGLKFFGWTDSYDHMRYHLNKEPFKCQECGKQFFCGRRLKEHKKRVHKSERFYCKECGKEHKSIKLLTRHLKSHVVQKENNYKCTKCDKVFLYASRLKTHLINAHESPMTCDICGRKVIHMEHHKKRVHPTAAEMKSCAVCKKKIPAIHWTNHMKNVHNDQMIPCKSCDRQFKTAKYLVEHIKRDHMMVRYSCTFCPKLYTTRTMLRYHQCTVQCGVCQIKT